MSRRRLTCARSYRSNRDPHGTPRSCHRSLTPIARETGWSSATDQPLDMARCTPSARFSTALAIGASAIFSASLAACGSSAGLAPDDVADAAPAPSPTTASTPDGGATANTPSPTSDAGTDAAAPSRCTVTETTVSCTHQVTPLVAGTISRDVYWQTPSTPPPPGGYPVVLVYQGSLGGPSLTWGVLTPSTAFGGFYQGVLQAMLLDHGFTVIAPEAAAGVAWQTNSGVPYELTTDKDVIDTLLAAIAAGQFGPANMGRLYATGISSGGYMTSRMAVSYPGKFRALAIQSASYATCLGPVCNVPSPLPASHPPTLFLHGALDTTVPLYTAERYYDELVDEGFETKKIVDPNAGHEWLKESPARVTEWFTTH
jgi:poly(3-hydroxyoctanoate) depolymerase